MNKKDLYQLIENIQSNVQDIPNLNSGGCGFFTLFIAEECEARNIKFSIPIIEDTDSEKEWDDIETNMRKIIEDVEDEEGYVDYWDKYDFAFAHSVMKIGRTYFDSEGIGKNKVEVMRRNALTYKRYDYVEKTYSIEEMRVALEHGDWNNLFDRDDIHCLKENIVLAFKDAII